MKLIKLVPRHKKLDLFREEKELFKEKGKIDLEKTLKEFNLVLSINNSFITATNQPLIIRRIFYAPGGRFDNVSFRNISPDLNIEEINSYSCRTERQNKCSDVSFMPNDILIFPARIIGYELKEIKQGKIKYEMVEIKDYPEGISGIFPKIRIIEDVFEIESVPSNKLKFLKYK